MAEIHLKMLGQFECSLGDGTPVVLQTRKAEVLLAYLALQPGIRHPRERLINLLWSDRSEEQARNSLRQALSAIKKPLADAGGHVLEIDRTTVLLDAQNTEADVRQFENLSAELESDSLSRAAMMYEGEFLEGINIRDAASQEWMAHERDRLKRIVVDVLTRLSQMQIEEENFSAAIESAETLVDHDPLQEQGWRLLMQAYHAHGERNHALLAYKRCHDVLSNELGVEPEPQTDALRDGIRKGELPGSIPVPSPAGENEIIADAVRPTGTGDTRAHPENVILVLPFDSLTRDEDQRYFSEGITEGIIVGLSRYPSLVVLSRNYSYAAREQKLSISDIASKFGARYVIEGSLRRTPGKIRITSQLVDADSGQQLWGKRFDSDIEKIFSIEDELTRTIVANIKGKIDVMDEDIAYRKPARDMRSYDLLMKGKYHLAQFNPEDNQLGLQALEDCIEGDPDCAMAHNYLYRIYVLDWLSGWSDPREENIQKAGYHVELALKLDPENSTIQSSASEYYLFVRDFERCEDHAERAYMLDPDDTETLATLSAVHAALGNVDLALEMADTCRTLDPYHPWIDWVNGIAYYTGKRYQDALDTFRMMPNPADEIEGWLAICYERLGQHTAAEKHLHNYVETVRSNMTQPPKTMEEWHRLWQATSAFRHEYDSDYPFDALCNAGLEQYIETVNVPGSPDSTPGIAVLPFDNLSGDADQEYFSDGITESIILNLSRFPEVHVKSRNSSFAYKEQIKSVGEISRALDVNYVVEGSVRKAGDRVRVTVQLIESETGNQVWGRRYDSDLEDILELEEALSRTIAATVTGRIESELGRIALAKSAEDQQTYDLLLAGIYHCHQFTRKDMVLGIEKLNLCLEREPDNVRAHSYLYSMHVFDWIERWTEDPGESFRLAGQHAVRAMELAPDDDQVLLANAEWQIFCRKFDKARPLINRAMEINPNNPEALGARGFLENMLGNNEAGLADARTCMQLDPGHAWGDWIIAEALFMKEDFEAAIQVLGDIISKGNAPSHVRAFLVITYVKAGNEKLAGEAMEDYLEFATQNMKAFPKNESEWRKYWLEVAPLEDRSIAEEQIELLIKAGISRGSASSPSVPETSDLPSIAVLPFENLSGDPEQEYFSDGITESIILNLSSFSGLNTKSRHSSFVYQNSDKSVEQIAGELGVQYLVEGSIRKSPGRARITVQLVECNTGNQLWGKRFDADMEDIFDLEQEVSLSIAGAVSGKVGREIQRILVKRPPKNMQSYDYFMRGQYYLARFTPESLELAREQLEKAILLDSDYADAHAALCIVEDNIIMENWTADRKASLDKSEIHVKKALELDPENAFVHAFMAEHLFYKREFDLAEQHADRAMELNPTLPDSYTYKAWALDSKGQFDEAKKYIEIGLELDPHHPWTGWISGEVYRDTGEYELALKAFRTMHFIPPSARAQIAACLAGLDRMDEARKEMKHYHELAMEQMPRYPASEEDWRSYWFDAMPCLHQEQSDKLFDLLVKAGLLELQISESGTSALAEHPAIAVLPFSNLSNDPDQEYFSDGITESIILNLGLFSGLESKSRHSCFAYKESSKPIRDVAEELGVQYLVEGSVRKFGDSVSITIQLTDPFTGNQLWGKRYDSDLSKLIDLEQELVRSVASTISGRIDHELKQASISRSAKDMRSYDYQMQGMFHLQRFSRDDLVIARDKFTKCLEADPENTDAHMGLGYVYDLELMEGLCTDRGENIRKAEYHLRKAMELDPDDPATHAAMCEYYLLSRKFEHAEFHADRAIELNPNLPDGYAMKTWYLVSVGEPEKALAYAQTCLQLDPHHPWVQWMAAETYRSVGEYDKAIVAFRSLPHLSPNVHAQIAACYAGLDQMDAARSEIQQYLVMAREQLHQMPESESAWAEFWRQSMGYRSEDEVNKLFDLLLKAGLCDGLENEPDELPSIAVLPFLNVSGDPEQDYFSDGLASDIVTILSRFRNLHVVASYSTAKYRDRKSPIEQIAEEQGVRYILDGSVRKSGENIRVNVQLIDSTNGENCWVEQYDRNLDDIFKVQDEITGNIAIALRVKLVAGTQEISWARGTNNFKAWELCAVATELEDSYIQDNNLEARRLGMQALELDPDCYTAWIIVGWAFWQEAFAGWGDDMDESLKQAEHAVNKAIEIDPERPEGLSLKGYNHVFTGDPGLAVEACLKAVSMSPGDAEGQALAAFALAYAGEFKQALIHHENAVRLCPICPNWFYISGAQSHLNLGDAQKAIELLQKGVNIEPESPLIRYFLVDALVESGQLEKAREVADKIRSLDNTMRIEGLIRGYSYNARDRERFRNNLAQMGFTVGEDDGPGLDEETIPSLAVLPFENLSGDPEQQYFSDGISSDIISTLSRFRGMRVVSRHSTLPYRGGDIPLSQIAEEQDVRHILEGNVRRSGDRVRVNVQLVDSQTEQNIWVETYDRDLDDLFAVQDEITKNICVALRVRFWEGDRARELARSTTSVNAWEYCTQASDLSDSYIHENILEARRLANLALELDPEYCYAWVILGWSYWQEAYGSWAESFEDSLAKSERAVSRALEISPGDPDAMGLYGCIHTLKKDAANAVKYCEKALAGAPGNAEVNALLAYTLSNSGRAEEAIPYYEASIRLSPIHPGWYVMTGAHCYRCMGELEKSITLYEQAIAIEPDSALGQIYYLDVLVEDGQLDRAREVAKQVRTLDSSLGITGMVESFGSNPQLQDRFRENLAKVGFTE